MPGAECTRPTPLWPRRHLLAALALAALPGAWLHAGNTGGAWLAPPPLPDLPLLDAEGRAVALPQALRARRIAVVSFFYTGCSTVCPPQTALLRELRAELDRQPGIGTQVLLVSISVDPLADGPAQLQAFRRRHGIAPSPSWLWLTGSPAHVAAVLRAFGLRAGNLDDHPNLLWLGDTARRRWQRSVALQSPRALAARVQEMLA